MKKWFVVHVVAGSEELFKRDLLKTLETSPLKDFFEAVAIPMRRRSKEDPVGEKIFAGYVLLRFDPSEEAVLLVARVPRFFRFAGGMPPQPLSDKEVQAVFHAESNKVVQKDFNHILVGGEVKVAKGPFGGFSGVVEQVDVERQRVKLAISIFGRMTSVFVDIGQLEI